MGKSSRVNALLVEILLAILFFAGGNGDSALFFRGV